MIIEMLTAGVITVGSGRGFVVEGSGERLVITAAHCLPFLPPAQSFFGPKERNYGPLLAPLGSEPRACAVCRFVDPIADIAVLGSPDSSHADEYRALTETATALSIGGALRHPVNFWVPGRLLSLDGRRCSAAQSATSAGRYGSPTPLRASAARCRARRSSRRSGRRSGSCAPPRRPGRAVPTRASPTTYRGGCCATRVARAPNGAAGPRRDDSRACR
jgi:hypothetical protein